MLHLACCAFKKIILILRGTIADWKQRARHGASTAHKGQIPHIVP
jgi:hypothetical protein